MSKNASALVQPLAARARADFERRSANRERVAIEALTRPLDGQDAIWWGATVRNLSATGIGLTLCFPFRAGTFLAVDLTDPDGVNRTYLIRVVHARDQSDGTWFIGGEFIKKRADGEDDLGTSAL
jgi:hypothetical protein